MINFYDTIIIGAGTAGLTAAVYTARMGKTALVLESSGIGGQISSSPLVENYPGFESISGAEFSGRLYEQALALGVTVELEDANKIEITETRNVYSENGEIKRSCNKIIIAAGQRPRKLGLQDEEKFEGNGISYCAVCDGPFYKNKTVAVVGGGNSALQSAKMLSDICGKVYLVHRKDYFKGEQILADELKTVKNVEFILNSRIEKYTGADKLSGVALINKNNKKSFLPADGLFVTIGHIPNTEIFKGVINLDGNGYIIASEDCKTNIEGVYAAGDCRTKNVRQLTTAAADGTVCALS
ncbi:MAG: FAD-dependent oxidoreductase [Oscillospiraceae bacterium]|nr:FAD-dependent oxidoreductase [Oscillospiraceae bacterium]